ncbi:mRNA cleavage and polyadenylation factor I complex, subunit RNA15 [Phaffia rhodozyma]|uniref:mRNA cleavage and polyadenylation factor I complex, subunit RNA15 n=1 Tax=Phaffia rhodozyma TaxID=264483 RepID=A0A0F7SMP6_PHARH|nr:mRNA cleavage and polyadenylation factor I complex, subunit RNA15 [Phaffia rhodozyma]
MAPSRANPRGVYISNVPYDMTEEQLAHVMSEAGPVAKTRLAFHPDTGRAKGFGFVDFYSETAASAVRNLNGYLINGRPLSVTFQMDTDHNVHLSASVDPNSPQALLQNPPRGRELDRGALATDAITQTLAAIPAGQLEEVLGRMKGLVQTSPADARQILMSNPQLSYALFQAMLMMNLVDPTVISRMTAGQPAFPPSVPPSSTPVHTTSAGLPPPSYPPAASHQPHYPPQQPVRGYPSYPPTYAQGGPPPPPTLPSHHQPASAGPPSLAPQQQGAPGRSPLPPPPQQQPPQAANAMPPSLAHLPPDQQAMLLQVLQMPKEQVDALPPDQRTSIMQLRAQFGSI